MKTRINYLSNIHHLTLAFSCLLFSYSAFSQCEIHAKATPSTITCGEESVLSVHASGDGTVMMNEDFNNGGFGSGWSSTPGSVMWNNPCSPSGVDGTTHAWMGNNTTVPRDIVTTNYDLSSATAGVTICFDLLFATQGNAAPCEGPDEPDEGVYLQYSTDGGTTWVTIHYFDPNGGNDPQLTNWHNWCFTIPAGAITSSTQFRWHQTNDSGQDYDHWGIDNVEIVENDTQADIEWGSPGDSYYYDYGVGSPGGDNPNHVSPTTTTTYNVQITTGNGQVCTTSVTVNVIDPVYDVNVTANPTTICPGDCATLSGNVSQVMDPGGIETYENAEYAVIFGTPYVPPLPPIVTGGPGTIKANMNINIQTLNSPTVQSGQILSVCLNGFTITPGFGCSATSLADVQLILECPDGTEVILADIGDLSGNTITDMCFSPSGGTPISAGSAPYTGTFTPANPISGVNGCTSNGEWTFKIRGPNNETCVPVGGIQGWQITFDDPPILHNVDYSWSPTNGLSSPTSGTNTQSINNQACPTTTTTYNLTVSNGVPGCATDTEPYTITVGPCNGCTPPVLTINNPPATCAPGSVDLSTAIDPSSDPATKTYYGSQTDANNAANPISSTVTASGSYWVRAEDPSDATCFDVFEIVVTINPVPTITVTQNPANCGSTDGEIHITVTNTGALTAPITYSIDGGTTTQNNGDFTGLAANSYNVVVEDGAGCQATQTVTVANSGTSEDPSFSVTNYCEGTTNTANITGTPGGTFTIVSPTGTGATIDASTGEITNGVGGTTYTIQYQTSGSCPATESHDVTVFENPTYTATPTNPSCGNSDGELVLNTNSGLSPFVFSIDNGATTQSNGTFTGLAAGSFNVLITDNNGCQVTGTASLSNATGPSITSVTPTPVSCAGNDGQIVVVATGGAGLQYSLDGGTPQASGTFTGVASGSHSVTVTDGNGCTASQTTTVDPASSTDDASFSVTNYCEGTTNTANITGTPGGTFTIVSPTGTGATIDGTTGEISNGVGGTTYTIQYQTNGSCPATETHDVTVFENPTYTATSTDPSCGNSDGELVLNTNSGLSPFVFSIDNGTTTQSNGTFTGLAAGSFNVLITDNNGCQVTGTESLSNATGPSITSVTPTSVSCAGNDGQIVVVATGGAGLQYSLDGGTPQASGTFTGVASGSHTITVTDGNGCTATQTTNVGQATPPTLSIDSQSDVSCNGKNDGTINVSTSGGSTPYTYSWMPTGPSGASATNLAPGSYTVVVTDNLGCKDSVTTTIAEPDSIAITSTTTPATCGEKDGAVQLSVTGGAGNYTYAWNPNVGTTDNVTNLATGSYDVTVTNQNGCSQNYTANVGVGGSFFIDASPENSTIDQGESVNVYLSINPNTAVDTIIWTPASGLSCSDCKNPVATPNESTTYIVYVTDTSGCVSTDTVNINVILPCGEVFVPNSFSPNTDGNNDFECVYGDCIVHMDFSIYNRWGEMVFHSTTKKDCWDGKYKGKLVQTGVYVYKLKATLKTGKIVEKSGNVTVTR